MEYIAEYVALVQFAGAFNFVFCTKFFHEHFSTHFINVSKKQKGNFDNIKNKISMDITSIESHSVLTQDGRSNEHELNGLNGQYKQILERISGIGDKLGNKIENQKQPAFSRQLFLLFGLYSLFAIFYMCKIGHLHSQSIDCGNWCNALFMFALVTILWWAYFLISEAVWLFKKSQGSNHYLLSPSFSWTIILFLAMTVCVLLKASEWPNLKINNDYKVYIIAYLPLLAFVSSIILFLITNALVWSKTIWYTGIYKIQLWLLSKKKDHVLSPYAHLKESAITIS